MWSFTLLTAVVTLLPGSLAIGEGILDLNSLGGIFRGFGDIFSEVNTTDVDVHMLMGRWHQVYKAAINFDVFKTQIYCPVSYFKPNSVMGPDGFTMSEAFHVIAKNGPIETYKRDVTAKGNGKFWVYTEQYFYPYQFYVVKAARNVTNDTYSYLIATDQNRLALTVMARDPIEFYQKYDAEVTEFLKQEGFGGDSFWNQPVAIYHGTDCYYPSPKEVFARMVMKSQQVGGSSKQVGSPLSDPLSSVANLIPPSIRG